MLLNGTEFCGNHTTCSNGDNDSYGLTCSCQEGYVSHRINYGGIVRELYSINLFLGCRDKNECTEGGNNCGANTDCTNTDGSWVCTCKHGFEGNPGKIMKVLTGDPLSHSLRLYRH